jgi:hypothetical protein
MQGERELRRRACLEAMGIAVYVARRELPGALPSGPVALSAAVAVPAADAEAAGAGVALAAQLEAPPAPRPPAPRRPPADAPAAASAVEPFNLAAVAVAGCLWLEELQGALLAREQVALIRAMAVARGWPVQATVVQQFAWPLHRNPQLDQGPEAARAALAAFLQRQLDANGCRALVLLGDAVHARVAALDLGLPCLCIRSTREMLAEPACKREVWRDLRAFEVEE